MKIKSKLRSAAELAVGMTIIATLLAACGGGGGTSAGTPSSTYNVTPGKGIMTGATVTIEDANGVALGNALTTAAGVAAVNIPATATGPFIISVSCLTSACSYYDEKLVSNVSGSATMPILLAVVPGATNTNIGVTAATNAAAQYALNTGAALTPTSVAAANDTVATSLGLSGANLLTPPTIIATNADYLAAKTGLTDGDKLASLSAAFAMSANGVSAMQAIADYGNAWKNAAITPAAGVIMPGTINTTELTQDTSGVAGMTGVPATTIPDVTAAMAAATTTVAANMTAVNDMYATGSSASGLSGWFMTGAASGVAADIITLAPGATANNYTFSVVTEELVSGAWSVAPAGKYRNYNLTPTGWVLGEGNGGAGTVVNNNDGTLTLTNGKRGTFTVTVQENVLDGTPIPGAIVATNYPAGSRSYVGLGGVTSIDSYGLWNNSGANNIYGVTDLNGVALTALPTLGTDSFCANGFVFNLITAATQTAATSQGAATSDNYEVLGSMGCTATSITNSLLNALGNTNGNMGMGFATLTGKQTGNTVVPVVGYVQSVSTNTSNTSATANAGYMASANGCIIGVAGGVAQVGCSGTNNGNAGFIPAGTAIPKAINSSNKIATDAELGANGYIALP